jgi:hypothetical protein
MNKLVGKNKSKPNQVQKEISLEDTLKNLNNKSSSAWATVENTNGDDIEN